jgi:hypothetical protein
MNLSKQKVFVLSFILVHSLLLNAATWWPEQKAPKSIVHCKTGNEGNVCDLFLAQSLAGLAAQALNENAWSEGVWIDSNNDNYTCYFHSLLKRTGAAEGGEYDVWSLAARYRLAGVARGYVLYDYRAQNNEINLATVYAGLQKGILIDVTQEAKAKKLGFVLLYDARGKDIDKEWKARLHDKINRNLLVIANPRLHNNRDFAIAHKSMVYYGTKGVFENILSFIRPVSPIIGWNEGGEFEHVAPATVWGHVNTASDHCLNLSMLSINANSDSVIKPFRSVDPACIDWNRKANFHSFVMSDGDNMQWTFGSFIDSPDYWANRQNSRIPMSFTSCVVNLSMASPDVYARLCATQPKSVSVVEYGGGYQYPDLFASKRSNPDSINRVFARKVNEQMKKTGVRVFGFICKDVSSASALNVYRIYAEEIENLAGMIAVQYVPYNGGQGKIFFVKNKKGVDIPVVTAKYQLWANLSLNGSGGPDVIARQINKEAKKTKENNASSFSWSIVHAWSYFREEKNGDITDISPKENKTNGTRGVTPVQWCKERLSKNTVIVPVEELLWRIRMEHDPVGTKKTIDALLKK